MTDRRNRRLRVLDAEVRRWSVPSCEEPLAKLGVVQAEVEFKGRPHQVEVELLADTPDSLEVIAGVDDGTLSASIIPATEIFRRRSCSE